MTDAAAAQQGAGDGARGFWTLALTLGAAKLALHLSLAERYGIHRDELYFIVCGQELAWGYVDHPPLVPAIARAMTALFGLELYGLRAPPALAGAATLVMTMALARSWGGGRGAQLLAGLAVLLAPAYLRMGKILCIPVFEPLFWTGASMLVARVLAGGAPRLWLSVGAVAGVGLLNKHTMLLWGAGLALGLLLTGQRRALRSPWPWAGLGIAALIVAPHVLWQVQHGAPTLEFLANMRGGTLARIPRALFVAGQLLYMHPLTAPIWLSGLWWLLRAERARALRPLGFIFPFAFVVLLITGAKPYYLAAAYPLALAAGAVQLEQAWARRPRWLAAFTAALTAGGLALGSVCVPLLPLPEVDAALGRYLGLLVKPTDLTHDLHDEYGWREQAATVAVAYRSLTPEQQASAHVLTVNYGQASAINLFGPEHGLPRATTGHMSYFMWGPPEQHGTLLVYGLPDGELDQLCATRQSRAVIDHPLANAYERGLHVYACEPRRQLREVWRERKRYFHGRAPAR